MPRRKALGLFFLAVAFSQFGCAAEETLMTGGSCAPQGEAFAAVSGLGSGGEAAVFKIDPIVSSGNEALEPSSPALDGYRAPVELSHLSGRGVLEGKFVDVRNGLSCGKAHGAFAVDQRFVYSHADEGFQEAMTYFYGNAYRDELASAGVLESTKPMKIVAHCMNGDNAYYLRAIGAQGLFEEVCIGDSVVSPGASYADDASVVMHELQHATTSNTYSMIQDLNQFWYDDAGALNEALSDALALIQMAPDVEPAYDARLFGRWALGTFFPGYKAYRGAHRCPVYSQGYPECAAYQGGSAGFSADQNRVSYSYPDGVGWPYGNNFGEGHAPNVRLRTVFEEFSAQEEIHNAGMPVVGMLWDVYERLRDLSGDATAARRKVYKAAMASVAALPKPSALSRSPVTFQVFALGLRDAAGASGFSASERSALDAVLTERGFLNAAFLPAGWAAVGSGAQATPGMLVLDQAGQLKSWLGAMGLPATVIAQSAQSGANNRLDAGETVAVWFDVSNLASVTAASLQLSVSIVSGPVEFLSNAYNFGVLSPSLAQIRYAKVNGSAVVQALQSAVAANHVPTGTSYFQTNPHFFKTWMTALWLRALPGAQHGAPVVFQVEVTPANGPAQVLTFQTTIGGG